MIQADAGPAINFDDSAAGDITKDGNLAAISPDRPGIHDSATDHKPTAAGRLERAGVGDRAAASVDDQRCVAAGNNGPAVYERQLSTAERPGSGYRVVGIDQPRVGGAAE